MKYMETKNTKITDSINAEIIKNLGHFECGANKEVFELVIKARDLLIKADVEHQIDINRHENQLKNMFETAPTLEETEHANIKRELEAKNAKVLRCWSCNDIIIGAGNFVYHGDQTDILCDKCARVTKHSDTAYAGMFVKI